MASAGSCGYCLKKICRYGWSEYPWDSPASYFISLPRWHVTTQKHRKFPTAGSCLTPQRKLQEDSAFAGWGWVQLGLKGSKEPWWCEQALPGIHWTYFDKTCFRSCYAKAGAGRKGSCGSPGGGIVRHSTKKWASVVHQLNQSKTCVRLNPVPKYPTPAIKRFQPFIPRYPPHISGSSPGIRHCSAVKGVAFRILPWQFTVFILESLNLTSRTKYMATKFRQ